jgi:hypothetical protein
MVLKIVILFLKDLTFKILNTKKQVEFNKVVVFLSQFSSSLHWQVLIGSLVTWDNLPVAHP